MSAAFFGLALVAALNPKLLAVDLIFMGNRRPRLLFTCFLLGGMGIALAIGLLDVFVVHAHAITAQRSASAGLDLALGIPLLVVGALLGAGRLHGRRRKRPPPAQPSRMSEWSRRVMQDPRLGIVLLIGVLAGTPGASYLAALHMLVTGKTPTTGRVIAVMAFVIIEFALIIVPFAALAVRPESTERTVKRLRDWLVGHSRQLVAAAALLAGTFMVITGVLRLS